MNEQVKSWIAEENLSLCNEPALYCLSFSSKIPFKVLLLPTTTLEDNPWLSNADDRGILWDCSGNFVIFSQLQTEEGNREPSLWITTLSYTTWLSHAWSCSFVDRSFRLDLNHLVILSCPHLSDLYGVCTLRVQRVFCGEKPSDSGIKVFRLALWFNNAMTSILRKKFFFRSVKSPHLHSVLFASKRNWTKMGFKLQRRSLLNFGVRYVKLQLYSQNNQCNYCFQKTSYIQYSRHHVLKR